MDGEKKGSARLCFNRAAKLPASGADSTTATFQENVMIIGILLTDEYIE